MKSEQPKLIDQLRKELGDSEDTEHLIDCLLDAWSTLEMLEERFGETRARPLYTAPAHLPFAFEQFPVPV